MVTSPHLTQGGVTLEPAGNGVARLRWSKELQAQGFEGASDSVREQVELAPVRMGRVHHRRVRPEAPGSLEQLDRAQPVLGEALLDLARLLVGVDVQPQALRGRVASDLLQPVGRAGAHGVGGKADGNPGGAE